MKQFLLLLFAFVPCLFASGPHPSLPAIGSLDGLGVNIHFTDPKPGELEMIRAAGFKWVRMDFGWGGTERKLGEYDFAAYDRLVGALEKNGLHAVFILDYANRLYDEGLSPHTDEGRAAFAKWAVAAVSHFKGKGFLWEMWNEPNLGQFWKPKPDVQQYIALAKTVGEELRKAGLTGVSSDDAAKRGECFIGPASSTIDLAFLEACFQGGLLEYFDGVSVHPYRQKGPETVEEEYRKVRALIRKYAPQGKTIPVLSGEWGYSTAWSGLSRGESGREEMQAKYLPRMFLTNIANDVPLSIWYDWRDDGDDPKEAEHRFGLVRRPYREGQREVYEPKPAYRAMQTLAAELAGMKFNKRVSYWPHAEARDVQLLFWNGNAARYVAWSLSAWGSTQVAEWLPVGSVLSGRDFLGSPRRAAGGVLSPRKLAGAVGPEVEAKPSTYGVSVDSEPAYFTPVNPDASWRMLAAWERAPLEVEIASPGNVKLKLAVENPFEKPLAVATYLTIDSKWGDGDTLYHTMVAKSDQALKPGTREVRTYECEVTGRETSKSLQVWAAYFLDDRAICEVCQPVPLIVTNPLRVEMLPLDGGNVPIQIVNSSDEGLEARMWVSSNKEVKDKFSITIPKGRREIVQRVPRSVFDGEKPGDLFPTRLRVNYTNGSALYDREVGIPFGLAKDLFQKCTAIADGAREVAGTARVESASPAGEELPAGGPALRVKYSMGAGWKFIRVSPAQASVPPAGRIPRELLLWLRGDGMGCQARIRFRDATGQTFQSDGPKIDFRGWKVARFPMDSFPAAALPHWGGENDGVVHQPITWDSILLLDNVSREPVEGELFICAPTLVY